MQVLTLPQSYASLLASFAKDRLFIGVYFFVNLQFFFNIFVDLFS